MEAPRGTGRIHRGVAPTEGSSRRITDAGRRI
jgi:hypothetical protein